MSLSKRVVIGFFRWLTSLLCHIDDAQLGDIPAQGPMIIITNHIGLVEIPILYTRLQPRLVSGMVAAVRWQKPLLRWMLDACEAIPLRRGEPDIKAMRWALALLRSGRQVIIFPEGTRSDSGQLQRGKPGAAFLAHRSGVPIVPIAHYGGEQLSHKMRQLQRTDFHVRVGTAFRLVQREGRVTAAIRQQMTDEMMFRLAALLPPSYRGEYADLTAATCHYLHPVD